MSIFRPMLACTVNDYTTLPYPVYASAKLDGIRCIVLNGVAMSRSLKPLPNIYVQRRFGQLKYNGFDGELTCGDTTSYDLFKKTTSAVMSDEAPCAPVFRVFDTVLHPKMPYSERKLIIAKALETEVFATYHRQTLIKDKHEMLCYIQQVEAWGYEGVVLRRPDSFYKFGRGTVKEGCLMKIKPFSDTEATIIGGVELLHNKNEATLDERGFTKRSTAKAGKVSSGMLGTFRCWAPCFAEPFEIGTGFTEAERIQYWKELPNLIGKQVRFKYQAYGSYNKPRSPVFLGFREEGT